MAYIAPTSLTTGDLVTAAIWNADVVANEIAINAGAIAIASQAIGDVIVATSTTQLGRVADVAVGQVLVSGGVATAPAYSASPSLTSLTLSTPLTVPNGGTGVGTRTAYGVIVGGTTATGATQTVTPGTSGYLLTSGGASAVPTWAAAAAGIEQAFRGLHLRTSPNANVAATTVSVLGLTQWTADDGTLVDDTLTNNTALITTSGAGGLDTGAEAASTWYEIYRIRKSSDGTLNTLLHRAKDYFLDESQTAAADLDYPIRRSTAPTRTKLAQSFDTDEAGKIEIVDLLLNRDGAVASGTYIWVTLEADSAGSPSGTALATSAKSDASLIADNNQWIRFPFYTPLTAVAGTTYWLVIQGDWTASDTVYIKMVGNAAGGYAAGTLKSLDSGSWVDTSDDMNFKVYVTRNDASITMPTGYDQKCLLGYVYNDSGSNFDAFVAKDREVQYLERYEIISSLTATIPTLTDGSIGLPPVPVRVELWGLNNTAGSNITVAGVPDGIVTTNDPGRGGTAVVYSATNGRGPMGTIHTEFQAIYARVTANTGSLEFVGYRW